MSDTLRLAFATGTEPGKWFERYRSTPNNGPLQELGADDPLALVLNGEAELALARIPSSGNDPRIDEDYHVVKLYEEAPGVAVPKDSVFAELGETVSYTDLAGEIVNYQTQAGRPVDPQAVRDALQIVAANVGIVIAPKPLLKNLSKKQIKALELEGMADYPATAIALVWPKQGDTSDIQAFVGVCRGRKPSSSRGQDKKLTAREKSKAKQARRAAASAAQSETSKAAKEDKNRRRKQTLSKRKNAPNRGKRR